MINLKPRRTRPQSAGTLLVRADEVIDNIPVLHLLTGNWHLSAVRGTASSRQLLEVERTCRRRRRTDAIGPIPVMLTDPRSTSKIAIG